MHLRCTVAAWHKLSACIGWHGGGAHKSQFTHVRSDSRGMHACLRSSQQSVADSVSMPPRRPQDGRCRPDRGARSRVPGYCRGVASRAAATRRPGRGHPFMQAAHGNVACRRAGTSAPPCHASRGRAEPRSLSIKQRRAGDLVSGLWRIGSRASEN